MGTGLAALFARAGMYTALYDPSPGALARASSVLAERGDIGGNLPVLTDDLTVATKDAELVIEACPEQAAVKRELFAAIAPLIGEGTLVASNTSSIPLETLAEAASFGDRLVIAHFFYPADLVPLVELVARRNTRKELLDRLRETLEGCGKQPVLLKKDYPGFIANRLQAAVLREACSLLEAGVADAKQIDRVMTEGPGLRWAVSGPFETSDYGGLDIWSRVADNLFPTLDNRQTAPDSVSERASQGRLGVKSGSGFYEYGDERRRTELAVRRERKLRELAQWKKERSGQEHE